MCSSSALTFDITIMADTGFGQRPLSDPIMIGCKNTFFDLQYNFFSSTFTCKFLNQMDTSVKYCSIVYGDCDQWQTQSAQGNSTPGAPNTVTLTVISSNGSVCYSAEASNGSFILVVEGRIQNTVVENVANTAAVIAGVVVAVLTSAIISIMIVITVVGVVLRRSKRKGVVGQRVNLELSIINRLKLEPINNRTFRRHTVWSNCSLKDAIDFKMKFLFKRGHAYYEFIHDIENISKEKELIFMKDTGKYYTPIAESSVLQRCGVIGEGVKRPTFEGYRIFVQSTGSGARHLPIGSMLLYEHKQEKEWKPEDAPLVRITSDHFVISKVPHGCTIKDFCRERDLERSYTNLSILLEFNSVDESNMKGNIRDVILMDKKDGTLFSGPIARSNPSVHETEWRVFILANFNDETPLKAGSLVIHQNPKYLEAHFYVLTVDEDNVQMSDFIKRALGVTEFENGKAYYEFTQTEEDLVSYKEVVRMRQDEQKEKKQTGEEQKKQSGEEQQKSQDRVELLQMGIKWFYWIGAPGIGIQRQRYENYRLFVQSTSQGSRCLKCKTLLLYKVQK